MVLFLAIVSGISLSCEIAYENHVFDTSKLTLNAIGIIAQNSTINLKNVIKKFTEKPFKEASNKEIKNIITNKYILDLFNS